MSNTAEFRDLLNETASELGMEPATLAAIISYETAGTFSPTKRGPTTKWGQHRGLIQFGEPQAKRYGVDWNDPLKSQLGKDGAVVKYFRASGWKPGMGLLDAYSIVNAGGPGRYNASDTAAGGAPGTVQDKVRDQFGPHISRAERLMGGKIDLADLNVSGGGPRGQNEDAYPERGALADRVDVTPTQAENIYRAYINGEMSADEIRAYEADVMSGRISIPDVSIYEKPFSPDQEANIYRAYVSGEMTEDEARDYERDMQMGKISFPADAQPKDDAPPEPEKPTTIGGQALRGLGLGARAVGQGLASLGGIVYDPAAALINTVAGTDIQQLRDQASQGMTALGMPTPQTGVERVLSAAQEGAAGAIGGVGVAPAIAKLGGTVATAAGQMLGAGPVSQVAGGLGAGAAGQAAQEAGAGPIASTAAALAGGMAGGVAANRFDLPAQAPAAGVPARVEPPVTATAKALPAQAVDMTPEALGALVRKASTSGMGSAKAAAELAKAAKINPDAMAAAQRLGIDVPADVFSDHHMVKEAVGMTRSVAGEASAQWREAVAKAAQRADDVIDALDGAPDLASISDKVQRSLTATRDGLKSEAAKLYDDVDKAVPRRTQMDPSNVVRELNGIIEDLGGINGMSGAEKRLFGMVTNSDQPVTYEALMREKRQIGRAIAKQGGPYDDADSASLKRLYGALAQDQMDNVAAIAGDDAKAALELANGIYAKQKALEDRIVSAFGKDLEGSVAGKLRVAITQASKGDAANLNRVLSVVPEDLQREAVMTALSAMSRSGERSITAAADGIDGAVRQGFGFAEYAKLYRGLRQNAPIYARIDKVVGPETAATMRDLYEVSKRITDARANVLTTGKANQGLVQSMLAEGIVARVLNSSVGRTGRGGVGAAAGAAALGPIGGMMGMAAAAGKIGGDRTEAVSALFRSPKFQAMLAEAATKPQPSAAAVKAVRASPEFNKWAKVNNIADPSKWLFGALSGTQAARAEGK